MKTIAIHTLLSRTLGSASQIPADSVCVAIDVLRASTTICAALSGGARAVVPVENLEAARALYEATEAEQRPRVMLGGERGGLKPEGFHLGNSPLEYTPDTVRGKTIILATTNGTPAFALCKSVSFGLVASFTNLSAVSERIIQLARFARPVTIVCAGSEGDFSYEDALCAGALAQALAAALPHARRSDATQAVAELYELRKGEIKAAVGGTRHAARLTSLGFERDVERASLLDYYPVVPRFNHDNEIIAS